MIIKSLKPVALSCVVAALAGCAMSPIPVAENFPLTTQKKVRSAGHWQLLSQDVVEQTLRSLEAAGATPQTTLFVAVPAQASDFDKAFREFLITELVHKGRRVLTSDTAMLTINYQTQIVKHYSGRPHFVPGLFTAVTAGLYVAHGMPQWPMDAQAAGGLAFAGVADYGASVATGGPTSTELVLSTTVIGAGRYMSRKTDVYYVEESDTTLFSSLYQEAGKIGVQSVKVVGP